MAYGHKGGKGRILGDKEKARNVEFIVYDDGVFCPKDESGALLVSPHGRMVSYLDSCGCRCALSPLHDQDVFDLEDVIAYRDRYAKRHELPATAEEVIAASPKVGDPKEPHRHLHMYAQAPHAVDWWLDEMIRPLCPDYPSWRVYQIINPFTATRYLAHMDSKDKAKYQPDQVEGFGGMDLSPLWASDEIMAIYAEDEVKEAIRANGIVYFHQLYDWACSTGDIALRRQVKGCQSFWNTYLSSRSAQYAAKKNGGTVKGLIG